MSPFPTAPRRTGHAAFAAPSSLVSRAGVLPNWTSSVDVLVAGAADDQGFAVARGHPLGPFGPLGPTFGLEVLEVPNVVYFNATLRAAQLAGVSTEPLQQLRSAVAPNPRGLIVEDADRGLVG